MDTLFSLCTPLVVFAHCNRSFLLEKMTKADQGPHCPFLC